MNIKLYRQQTNKTAAGNIDYQGQDSHPYADNDLLIVADGLGGRGGFPHYKIDERILDRNEIYGVLFDGVFSDEVEEDFKTFVIDNFEELFISRSYYFDCNDTVRRSGYFASRIVTAIALHEIKYNPDFNKKAIFDSIEGATEEQRDEIALGLGRKLAGIIADKLAVVAERGGFEMEVKNKGAYLLPSTLTVALLNERENDVQVLYLWAGDSRGYTWSVRNGLRQITEDHEQDETMTNNISLSRDFTIEGRFLTVERPCAILNTSDGVYKSQYFASPIDQEYLFLLAISTNSNADAAMKFLESQYQVLSKDDSSTLALKSYDYLTYEEFKAAVLERLEAVKREYIDRLPGIFEEDYASALYRVERPLEGRMGMIADELIEVDEVYSIVKQDMINKNYAPYLAELREAEESGSSSVRKKRELLREIRSWVESNWIMGAGLKYKSSARGKFIDDEEPSKVLAAIKKDEDICRERYYEKISEVNGSIGGAWKTQVKPIIAKFNNPLAVSCPEIAELLEKAKTEMQRACDETFAYLESVCSRDEENVKALCECRSRRKELCARYAEQDAEAITEIVERIISAPDSVEVTGNNTTKLAQIAAYHAQYNSVEEDAAPGKSIEEIERRHVLEYWRGNTRLYGLIWTSHSNLIPERLYDVMIGDDEALRKERRELREKLATRTELYERYESGYYADYRSSKI